MPKQLKRGKHIKFIYRGSREMAGMVHIANERVVAIALDSGGFVFIDVNDIQVLPDEAKEEDKEELNAPEKASKHVRRGRKKKVEAKVSEEQENN